MKLKSSKKGKNPINPYPKNTTKTLKIPMANAIHIVSNHTHNKRNNKEGKQQETC